MVSVILANLNKGNYISQAIGSVLHQSYRKLELIVVDGGSIDDSVEVAETLAATDSRIHLLVEKRLGKSTALNRGIVESTGELIAFIDSDDLYHKEKLSHQVRLMQNLPGVSMCHTNGWIIKPQDNPLAQFFMTICQFFPSQVTETLWGP